MGTPFFMKLSKFVLPFLKKPNILILTLSHLIQKNIILKQLVREKLLWGIFNGICVLKVICLGIVTNIKSRSPWIARSVVICSTHHFSHSISPSAFFKFFAIFQHFLSDIIFFIVYKCTFCDCLIAFFLQFFKFFHIYRLFNIFQSFPYFWTFSTSSNILIFSKTFDLFQYFSPF